MRSGEFGLDQEQDVAVLSIRGEHDLNTATELRSKLDRLIGDGRAILLDLSAATFIDSSTLGTILGSRRQAGEAGVGFEVVQEGGSEGVSRVLQITGVRDELPVHESREEALGRIAGGSGKPG